ncbi:Uncharacterized protein FKW44_011700, partial [Caligus rogercresseyi]
QTIADCRKMKDNKSPFYPSYCEELLASPPREESLLASSSSAGTLHGSMMMMNHHQGHSGTMTSMLPITHSTHLIPWHRQSHLLLRVGAGATGESGRMMHAQNPVDVVVGVERAIALDHFESAAWVTAQSLTTVPVTRDLPINGTVDPAQIRAWEETEGMDALGAALISVPGALISTRA